MTDLRQHLPRVQSTNHRQYLLVQQERARIIQWIRDRAVILHGTVNLPSDVSLITIRWTVEALNAVAADLERDAEP